jgi:hypothetical protein
VKNTFWKYYVFTGLVNERNQKEKGFVDTREVTGWSKVGRECKGYGRASFGEDRLATKPRERRSFSIEMSR